MISVYDEACLLTALQKGRLQKAAALALNSEGLLGGLDISVVDRSSIRLLNLTNRGIDEETDVLSFPTVESGQIPEDGFWGDVVICPEYIKTQAELSGKRLILELALLVIHGVLHLMGYDHSACEDEARMFRAQRQILERAGLDYEADDS